MVESWTGTELYEGAGKEFKLDSLSLSPLSCFCSVISEYLLFDSRREESVEGFALGSDLSGRMILGWSVATPELL